MKLDVKAEKIMYNYKDIKEYIKSLNYHDLKNITKELCDSLMFYKPNLNENEELGIIEFLTAIPIEVSKYMVNYLDSIDYHSEESKYIISLHKKFLNNQDYVNKFLRPLWSTKLSSEKSFNNFVYGYCPKHFNGWYLESGICQYCNRKVEV